PRIKAAAPLISRTLHSPTLDTTLLVMGVDLFAEMDFRDFDLDEAKDNNAKQPATSNGGLNFLIDPRAIAITEVLAQKHGLKVGDPLDIFVGAERKRFRVDTILRAEQLNRAYGGDFALLDIAAAQEAFSEIGRLSQIDLVVDEAQLEAVATRLRQIVPADAVVQRPAQRGSQVAGMLAAFQLNLSALSCISIFVGAFLIYNAVAIAVVRRRAEIGILRAVGAGRGQLMRMFLIEAALIGLVGSILGLALGIGLAGLTLQAVSKTVSTLYIAVKAREILVPPWLWWGGPLAGTVLAIVSSLVPAHEAANTSPRAAMQHVTLHHATARFAWVLAAVGLALLALAFLLCQPFISQRSAFAGFVAAFATLSGFALVTPLLTLWGGKAVQSLAGALFGIEGTLAGAYLQRALNRSSLVIAALMVSLAMMIGVSVMVRSFRQTVGAWVESNVSADLYISPATGFAGDLGPGLPDEVVRYATTLPAVRFADTIRGAEMVLGKQPIYIAANVLPGLVNGERKTMFVETVSGEETIRRTYNQGKFILVSERFKSLLGYGAGDTLRLTTPSGPRDFFIGGVFYDYTPNECLLYMPQSLYRRYWRDYGIDGIALYLKKDVATDTVKQDLQRRFGAKYQLTIQRHRELHDEMYKIFDQTFAVTYALQLIAILIAAIGIFDTLIALLLERSREIATLRAMGASGAQIIKMTYIEFGLIALFAW
ncbi:MAG: FtsX-like permease family protein, partial [Armatimonadota bacterium]|nr:FtsX-like permease family protein [Armatimonadota bacterium]